MIFTLFSLNGNILPSTDATVPYANIEYCYGFGVYEHIRVANGIIYFLDEHIARLMRSAESIELSHPFAGSEVTRYVRGLVAALNTDALNIKILLIGAPDPKDAALAILPLNPRFVDKKYYRDGVSLITVQGERVFKNAKTLNMLPSYLAYKKAKEAGCYDALFLHPNNTLAEGTLTNLFIIKDNVIYTAPREEVLEGVTRTHVLQVAQEHNIPIVEKIITHDMLRNADGVFLTSTSSKVLPVSQIDDRAYTIPELTHTLMARFDTFLHNYAHEICKHLELP